MEVLLLADQPGWAWAHRANDLMSINLNKIHFNFDYWTHVATENALKYDTIYAPSIPIAKKLIKRGIPSKKIAAGFSSIRSVYDFIDKKGKVSPSFITFVNTLKGVNTGSDEIYNMFKDSILIFKTRTGIFENVFKPAYKLKTESEPFRIGWVGRIDKEEYREHKGYDIVLKALQDLNVELETRTFHENRVPRQEMVSFYQSLDLFICSSHSEQHPMPVLEAAACGIPIVSTRVGIVPELIQSGFNGLIVPRNAIAIREAVRRLMADPVTLSKFSNNIRKSIVENWTWNICKKDWEEFFLRIS